MLTWASSKFMGSYLQKSPCTWPRLHESFMYISIHLPLSSAAKFGDFHSTGVVWHFFLEIMFIHTTKTKTSSKKSPFHTTEQSAKCWATQSRQWPQIHHVMSQLGWAWHGSIQTQQQQPPNYSICCALPVNGCIVIWAQFGIWLCIYGAVSIIWV